MLHEKSVTTQTWHPPPGPTREASGASWRPARDARPDPRPVDEPPPSQIGMQPHELGWSLVALAGVLVGALVTCGFARTLLHAFWP